MGMGYRIKCDKCGKTDELIFGVGMMYPESCEELTESVRRGRYGVKHKQALDEHPDALVDAEMKLYKCECGYWHMSPTLDICETEEKIGRWTVAAPVGKFRLIKEEEDEKVVIEKFPHLCPKCGKKMKDITENWSKEDLICTKCGKGKMSIEDMIMWD